MLRKRVIGGGLVLALAALVAVGLWQTSRERAWTLVALTRHPERVMGTTCTLVAVVPQGERARGDRALAHAETELRAVEARMSTWLKDSEISRLNAAGAGEEVALSRDSLRVLRAAQDAAAETAGAFDVTCGPLIELWKRAGKRGRVPTERELAEARTASSWDLIELTDAGAVKRSSTARVDLGGVAKGYALDRAVRALEVAGVSGGLVEVGGDLICLGQPPSEPYWKVDIRNPFGGERLGVMRVEPDAVCTSGNYARFTEIEGKRLSHIIDPRTGRPADAVPSATVTAHSALTADIWATALSVLGEEGFRRLPAGVEALLILGSADDYRIVCTDGFRGLLRDPLPSRLTVWNAVE